MANIGIIIGSTRPGRFGPQPAEWLKKLSTEHPEHTYEIVSVADANLPLLNESKPAAMQQYEHDHTKAWSKTIASYDGYILLTPEYNHTVAASLTNAISYVFYEWANKPVALVSYGSESGGIRAVEHLRAMSGYLGMFDISSSLTIPNYFFHMDDKGTWQPDDKQTERAHKILGDIGFWADKFNPIRAELSSK